MTRIPISLEVRCLRIKAKWSLRKDTLRDEWNLVPQIYRDALGFALVEEIEEPWELRNRFLRMKHEEKAALELLNEIGIWNAFNRLIPAWARAARLDLNGAFGHRFFSGWAQPITFEDFWKHQEHWNNLLRNPKLLREEFRPPPREDVAPGQKVDFAIKAGFQNTLEIHMEWRPAVKRLAKGSPSAVVQPITGHELLMTTAHVDLISGAMFQVCQRSDCGIPFTGRKRKYCQWYCGHIESVRDQRRPK